VPHTKTPPAQKQLIYIPFDQLTLSHGVIASAAPTTHSIVFVESERVCRSQVWHLQRLWFLISSARHFAAELTALGFEVHWIVAPTTVEGIEQVRSNYSKVVANEQSSHRLNEQLLEADVELHASTIFITSRLDFRRWAETQKSLTMENFYRWQRQRLNLLMEDGKPIGGQWNFDHDNRLPPPKGEHPWPTPLQFELDAIDVEVLDHIASQKYLVTGQPPTGMWATTRTQALKALEHFCSKVFADFGPYEDAMTTRSYTLNHSVLSPYINNGLLDPREVVSAAISRYNQGGISIASLEGFVRQIIGWREYINGVYWFFETDYKNLNALEATEPLPELFNDSSQTQMNCLKHAVMSVEQTSYAHHIQRLMILSNFATLVGVLPQQLLDWMRRMFIDAADWVMVPNVIGMGAHADNGRMMTKPYVSGGNYIKKMSDYCKGCSYNPAVRVGDDACPFTTLYWDYLDRHSDVFISNHRMARQIYAKNKLADLPAIRARAEHVRNELRNNAI
jgi:deoxyribodipyrimidine photolyase-related protein